MERAKTIELGKLSINDRKGKNDIELKANNPKKSEEVLITSFLNANIDSTERTGSSKSAKIHFSRDPTAKHNYCVVTELQNDKNISHYSLEWINPLPSEEFCVHLRGDQHWYSTYEESNQRWPIDKNYNFKSSEPFSTNDQFHNPIGGVLEYLFLGSDGFALFIERSSPLFIRRNSNSGNPLLCFSGDYHKSPYNHAMDSKETKIVFHLMSANDLLNVYTFAAKKWIPKPNGIPDERMIKYPIWSTWAKYHSDINQDKVLEFAKEISFHGLPNSQIEIDDKWEAKYGDFEFDHKKFPNPKEMVTKLKAQGYRVTLWVYPFVNTDSEVFNKEKEYFIKDQNQKVLLQNWWNGKAAHIDFTNKKAQKWFVSRLQHISNTTGIDSYKFDAGELGWVNPDFRFSDQSVQKTPVVLSQLYAETATQLGNLIETRVGYHSQHLPIFVRMLDKISNWSYGAGLKTLIPTALMMSIAGYHFVLPDMIGGNAYGNFPSKELYIRWLEVNTFMPTLQFSITPWDFKESSQEVLNITKSMLKLHEQYSPLIISLAKNAVKTGEPIIRPLWWVAPNDPNTYTIDDQFLVGNDLLVAPVTSDKTRKRNIYLPSGQWKDQKGVVHTGPQTLKDFRAELHELPFFVRK